MNEEKEEEITLLSLNLPDRLLAILAVYAHENDMKINEAINSILAEYIRNNHGDLMDVEKAP